MASQNNVPPELKPTAPYIQRAGELKGHDDVMRYWCLYHAAQLAMTMSPNQGDARTFMFALLDQLEELKEQLSDNEAVTVDVAGQAYVQNFCDKVFNAADNEDRSGKATKATVRNFLAAASFMEVLASFGDLDADQAAKLKYAKWKAADIAKALKEGRQPHAGPAVTANHAETDLPRSSTSTRNTNNTEEDDAEVEAQLLRLTSQSENANLNDFGSQSEANTRSEDAEDVAAALEADANPTSGFGAPAEPSPSYPFPAVPTSISDTSATDAPASAPTADELGETRSQPLPRPGASASSAAFPSLVMPNVPAMPIAHESPSQFPATPDAYKPFSPLPSTALAPPAPSLEDRSRFNTPSALSPDVNPLATPMVANTPNNAPPTPDRPRVFTTATSPRQSKPLAPVPSFQVPALPHTEPIPADSYDSKVITQAQKHCKFAISALNYDDFAEARKQLRSALHLLDG